MNDELRRRLRDAAAEHRPDRRRMLARVERGMAAPDAPARRRPAAGGRGPAPWLRVAAATAAVTAVAVAGGYALSGVDGREPARAASESPSAPAVTSPSDPSSSAASPPSSSSSSSSPSSSPPAPPALRDGPLRADAAVGHSNAYWAQSEVTVENAEPLASLTVELRVARTAGVGSTGSWCTLPRGDVTSSVRTEDGHVVYRWTLRPGRTVPAGRHVFAGQYDHARGGRDAGGDRYAATAVAGGEALRVTGDFAPRKGQDLPRRDRDAQR